MVAVLIGLLLAGGDAASAQPRGPIKIGMLAPRNGPLSANGKEI